MPRLAPVTRITPVIDIAVRLGDEVMGPLALEAQAGAVEGVRPKQHRPAGVDDGHENTIQPSATYHSMNTCTKPGGRAWQIIFGSVIAISPDAWGVSLAVGLHQLSLFRSSGLE